jgi:hypothetical protein
LKLIFISKNQLILFLLIRKLIEKESKTRLAFQKYWKKSLNFAL